MNGGHCDNPGPGGSGEDAGVLAPTDSGVILGQPDAGAAADATTSTTSGEGFDASVADAGTPDLGTPDTGVPPCTSNADCSSGSTCTAQGCEACPDGVCSCRRDEDCPGTDICDHLHGTCGPAIVPCTEISVEETCVGRADCQAVYAGVNCRDAQGGACTSADPECTCETFSFAACIIHP